MDVEWVRGESRKASVEAPMLPCVSIRQWLRGEGASGLPVPASFASKSTGTSSRFPQRGACPGPGRKQA